MASRAYNMKVVYIVLLCGAALVDSRAAGRKRLIDTNLCQPLPAPTHGTIACGVAFPFYSCTASCDIGYQFPSGKTTDKRECDQMFGKWFDPPGKHIPDCVPTTTIPTTTMPTTTLPTVHRSCFVCQGPPEICEKVNFPEKCPPGKQYCINKLANYVNATRTVVMKCGTRDECQKGWFDKYAKDDKCTSFDQRFIYTNLFQCEFCCDTDNCNEYVNPPNKWHP